MLRTLLTIIVCGMTTYAAWGGDKVLKSQDFEDQIPGSIPRGWYKSWGNQGEDLFHVSSMYAVSGARCLLFDRLTGENEDMWGLSTSFPHITEGTYKMSFNIMVIGPGNKASFTFEFRDGSAKKRLFRISFNDRNVILGSYAKLPRKQQSQVVGKYEPKEWYNVTATFPATATVGKEVTLTLTQLSNPKNTKTVKSVMTFSKQKFGVMMLCVGPHKNGYQVFIDDVKVTQITKDKKD